MSDDVKPHSERRRPRDPQAKGTPSTGPCWLQVLVGDVVESYRSDDVERRELLFAAAVGERVNLRVDGQ